MSIPVCTKCGEHPRTVRKSRPGKYRNTCIFCERELSKNYARNKRKTNLEEVRAYAKNYTLNKQYGIDLSMYLQMLENQEYRCYLCFCHEDGAPMKKLCVDHCHQSGKVRGLLCSHCNTAIGMFKESVDVMLRAVDYLNSGGV